MLSIISTSFWKTKIHKNFPQRSSKWNLPKIIFHPQQNIFLGRILCFTWHLDPTRKNMAKTQTPRAMVVQDFAIVFFRSLCRDSMFFFFLRDVQGGPPSSYKWGYNSSYPFIRPFIGAITLFITSRGPPRWGTHVNLGIFLVDFLFKEVFVFVVKKWMKPLNKRTPSGFKFQAKNNLKPDGDEFSWLRWWEREVGLWRFLLMQEKKWTHETTTSCLDLKRPSFW